MARRKSKPTRSGIRADYIIKQAEERPRKRSYEAPLLAAGAVLLIGYPIVRDATADRMARNTYANAASCECAYSNAQCSREGGRWMGPWFALDPADREANDPGEGKQCDSRSSGGTGGHYYGQYSQDARDNRIGPRQGMEMGYRGGFGGTGRVRAVGG